MRSSFFRGIAIVLWVGVLAAPSLAAAPYRPSAPVRLFSEYPAPGKQADVQEWRVLPVAGESGEFALRFRHASASSDGPPFCEIKFLEGDSGPVVEWTGLGGIVRRSESGLLMMPGFPTPFEVLPVFQEESEKDYAEETGAGGRVFRKSFTVRWESVDAEKAESEGWLRVATRGPFRMVRVEDENEELVVRQLWAEDGTWWLFEETPFRRSWRTSSE